MTTALVLLALVVSFVTLNHRGNSSTESADSEPVIGQPEISNVPPTETPLMEMTSAPTDIFILAETNATLISARTDPPRPRSETNGLEVGGGAPDIPLATTNRLRAASPLQPTNLIELVRISPGAFVMGSPESETGRRSNEGPQTRVTISYAFWLGKYEVTVEQYRAMNGQGMQSQDPFFRTDNDVPVTGISWADATDFCRRLTEHEREAGQVPEGYEYRLPNSAEWEYACRAGTTTRFSFGDDNGYSLLDNYAWYYKNSCGSIHPVGTKLPNPWGLYDMHGNAMEWVLDVLKLTGSDMVDPVGTLTSRSRPSRGGEWSGPAEACRSAFLHWSIDSRGVVGHGFRVALAPRLSTQ